MDIYIYYSDNLYDISSWIRSNGRLSLTSFVNR